MEVREKFVARLLNNPESIGFTEVKFVHSPQLQLSHAVRMRCQYTCSAAGESHLSPPGSPDPERVEKMLLEYKFGVMVRREIPHPFPDDVGEVWREFQQSLIEAENESFIRGYGNAFAMAAGNCLYCHHDNSLRPCNYAGKSRPTFEALGINLQETLSMIAWEHLLVRDTDDPFQLFGLLLLN
ncbi:MAG: hypothetical protein JJU11_12125 [Candidatus Sumerlaeia bacterium]|nr:hypothetical protein [Candidatus Sumerlaeia bacterium]